MKSGTKVALGLIAGVAVGAGIGYVVATRTAFGRKAIDKGAKAIDDSDVRLPDPTYAVEVAYDPDQFAILDELVCECGAPIVESASDTATIDDVVAQIQQCIAKDLYPDFPWPPIPGDHPTVTQLWSEIALLARRAIITRTICPIPGDLS